MLRSSSRVPGHGSMETRFPWSTFSQPDLTDRSTTSSRESSMDTTTSAVRETIDLDTLPPYTNPPDYTTEAEDNQGHSQTQSTDTTPIPAARRLLHSRDRPLSYSGGEFRPQHPSHLHRSSTISIGSLSSQPGPVVDTSPPRRPDYANERDGQPGHSQTVSHVHYGKATPIVRIGAPKPPPATESNRADTATRTTATDSSNPVPDPTIHSPHTLIPAIRSASDFLNCPIPADTHPVHIPAIPRTILLSTASLSQDTVHQYEAPLRHGYTDIWLEPHRPFYADLGAPVIYHVDAPQPIPIPTISISPGIKAVADDLCYVLILQGSMGALRQKVALRSTQMEVLKEVFGAAANGYSVVFSAAVLKVDVARLADPGRRFCFVGNGHVEGLRELEREGEGIGLLC